MSRPRPIHKPHREIRSMPDDIEPSSSFEQESFLSREYDGIEEHCDNVEDDFFHRKQKQQQQQYQQQQQQYGNHGNNSSNSNFFNVMNNNTNTNNNNIGGLNNNNNTKKNRESSISSVGSGGVSSSFWRTSSEEDSINNNNNKQKGGNANMNNGPPNFSSMSMASVAHYSSTSSLPSPLQHHHSTRQLSNATASSSGSHSSATSTRSGYNHNNNQIDCVSPNNTPSGKRSMRRGGSLKSLTKKEQQQQQQQLRNSTGNNSNSKKQQEILQRRDSKEFINKTKKDLSKNRRDARRFKYEEQTSNDDIGANVNAVIDDDDDNIDIADENDCTNNNQRGGVGGDSSFSSMNNDNVPNTDSSVSDQINVSADQQQQQPTIAAATTDCAGSVSRSTTTGSDHSGSLLYGKPLSTIKHKSTGSSNSGGASGVGGDEEGGGGKSSSSSIFQTGGVVVKEPNEHDSGSVGGGSIGAVGGGGSVTSGFSDKKSTAGTITTTTTSNNRQQQQKQQQSNNSNDNDKDSDELDEMKELKRRKVSLLIDQADSVRFPFKKKLILDNMDLSSSDIPVNDLCNTSLGATLHKLSLAGNRLVVVPNLLVKCLPCLKTLDLSQCELHQLPQKWNLPQLKKLNVSINRLTEFPDEEMLEGVRELQELNLYGNKISDIIIPKNPRILNKLEHLNLGYNDLAYLPDELDHIKSLRVLKVPNNFLEKIPMRICDMEIRSIDVSSNPIIQPPTETCERGICSMKRYYACLKLEEQSKQRALEDVQRKLQKQKSKQNKHQRNQLKQQLKQQQQQQQQQKHSHDHNQQHNQQQQRTSRGGFIFPINDGKSVSSSPATNTAKRFSSAGSVATAPPAVMSNRASSMQAEQDDDDNDSKSVATAKTAIPSMMTMKTAVTQPIQHFQDHISTIKTTVQETIGGGKKMQQQPAAAAVPTAKPEDVVPTDDDAIKNDESVDTAAHIAPTEEEGALLGNKESLSSSIKSTALPKVEGVDHHEEEEEGEAPKSIPLASSATTPMTTITEEDTTAVNDTLKVIFVGMALAGKTSMIKRLIEGKHAIMPKRDERTVGVDIYEWDPKLDHREEIHNVNTTIEISDPELANEKKVSLNNNHTVCNEGCNEGGQCSAVSHSDVNVKFSVWDFAGQHVYHATHELFFSPRALYVLVWDMGATNRSTQRRKTADDVEGAFKLSYDSSDDEDEDDFIFADQEAKRADRALEHDIDEKVQFWVDCIQSSAPGAAIMPVATFDDYFESEGQEEAKRRCEIMKQRLLKHEKKRIRGLKERLKQFEADNRANDEGALRLRKLLCSYTRPKLIFGTDQEDSVVRVSGTMYTGFDRLSQKIVNIATGRDHAGWKYPIFRGHIGARIPRMRLEVREVVRNMRDRFKVVEWGYFISELRKGGGYYSAEDVSDALHFLANIGELSYFGNVFPEREKQQLELGQKIRRDSNIMMTTYGHPSDYEAAYDNSDYDDDDFEKGVTLSVDATSATAPSTNGDESSLGSSIDLGMLGLSQFVFLNPRWIVAAVACILRHDLSREIRDTRRLLSSTKTTTYERGDSFIYDANLNCPVITAQDACMLWQAKKFTKKAAERAQLYSNNTNATPFDFLQRLLIRFGVFVPIDLSIDKAYLGGKEYAHYDDCGPAETPPTELVLNSADAARTPNFFFLPSLLGPGEPAEAWTYKNTDSWKTTLSHSILFPDGVPPGLMERVTAAVLSSIYATAEQVVNKPPKEGNMRVKEILCWRTAFFVKLGVITNDSGELKECFTEIFTHLVDRESHLCVGSEDMGIGARRLVMSGKGQVGDSGRKLWNGGYLLVLRAVRRVMEEYGGLEYERQGFCPECLSKNPVSQASAWDWTILRAAAQNGTENLRCKHGHRVDTRLVTGPQFLSKPDAAGRSSQSGFTDGQATTVPVNELLRGVVVIGLWDGKTRKVVRVGSGFIIDRKRGLIVSASHTLMNIWGDKKSPFGENYYGLREGKVVIGVIPRKKEASGDSSDGTMAVFRYFAKIVAKDESIEAKGECHVDACVLRITTRMENDVAGDGEGCGDQPETLLLNNPEAMKRERLHQLKVTTKCELDEQVRILGFNQGGEGLLGPGERLNRYVDFARGYVCKKFASNGDPNLELRHRFKPREEIVIICPTIGGHSGGPCVNQQGEVIGILSRADPAENQRCYLAPAYEWRSLLKKARNAY